MSALTSTTRLDLAVNRGDDFRFEFDVTIAGALQDLSTGWTGRFQVLDGRGVVRATGALAFATPRSAAVLTSGQTSNLAEGEFTYYISVAKAALALDRTIFEGVFSVTARGGLATSARGRC